MTKITRHIAFLVLLFVPGLAGAQQAPQELLIKRGAGVFAASCTGYCHGANGAAGTGAPAMANRGFDASYITKVVTFGIDGTAMQGWGQRITKQELDAVIAYVKSLNGLASTNTAPPKALTPEAQLGRDLFSDTGGELKRCSNCHQVNGRGKPVAPGITHVPADVAALRNLMTPGVSTATVRAETFQALVVMKTREEIRLYDLTAIPPVLLNLPPAAIKLSEQGSWQHSKVLGAYTDKELESILAFLRAVQQP